MKAIFIYNNDFNSKQRLEQVEKYVEEKGVENIDVKLLTKIYDYVADKMDKEEHEKERKQNMECVKRNKKSLEKVYTSYKKPKDTETYAHINILKNLACGLRVNMQNNNTNIKYDKQLSSKNAARIVVQQDSNRNIAENINAYMELREYINDNEAAVKEKLNNAGINSSPHRINASINSDISVCKNGLINNNVNINVYNFSTFDKLKTLDIDYSNSNFIKECIRNYNFIEKNAHRNMNSTYNCIYLDIKTILEKDIYTDRQRYVLYKFINDEQLNATTERNILNYTIKKIIKHLADEN